MHQGLLVCLMCLLSLSSGEPEGNRQPRFNTLPTTTSTTTLSTSTVCYTTNAALTVCNKKKKRSIYSDPVTGEDTSLALSKDGIVSASGYKFSKSALEGSDGLAKSVREQKVSVLLLDYYDDNH